MAPQPVMRLVPCIQIHSIDWYKADDDVGRTEWVYVADSSSLSLVEAQTPLDEIVFAENPWVQEAAWLLPDLITMISVMNSTLLLTFDNIDG
ncbi:hypothetical protein BGZ61DRAFT_540108 [Ilyonectria robusta]|uniref:uncharacterized protein n=1 Tax=Ilyonectria robusta TaxID=1079257 RepID=UPI001E8ED0F7|nr:uncharacterized protein BGZ61DRAFT_540108 [Ilyonectria robusta]KAH8659536.1 hypothetical protein BGZ61DRAFT_540108 [Ilyonectria robusta]